MSLEIIPVDHPRRYPPRVTAFTERHWTALSQGIFLTTRCAACHKVSFPPKPICPHCWTDEMAWERFDGIGTLYSWTRIHAGPAIFEADLPYAVGIVDLDAGIRLASALRGPQAAWACGLPVRLVVLAHHDGPLLASVTIGASTSSL